MTTLTEMHEALLRTPARPGNELRRTWLLDSRDEPWSRAERDAHRLFRDNGLPAFETNYPVAMLGTIYYLDVAFPEVKLAIEIDGRAHHGPDQFGSDRWRQNDLVLDGWRVLRFTWDMITNHPQIVLAVIRQALAG